MKMLTFLNNIGVQLLENTAITRTLGFILTRREIFSQSNINSNYNITIENGVPFDDDSIEKMTYNPKLV